MRYVWPFKQFKIGLVSQNKNMIQSQYNLNQRSSMINLSETALISILDKAIQSNIYEKAINQALTLYQLKPYNISKLTPTKTHQIYQVILKKFYSCSENQQSQFWFENQLRIFVWVVIVHAYISNKKIEELSKDDWDLLSLIFNGKSPINLQFQTLCLLRRRKSKKWSQQQILLLNNIIRERSEKNRWNQIAKYIFIKSNKKYFRTPKQCRQQWINHLDPSKSRAEWTIIEDYQLIKGVMKIGKRWSKIAKQIIANQRTEHMVKNRYKSLLNNQMKRMLDCEEQDILIAKLKQRLQSSPIVKKYLSKKKQNTSTNNQINQIGKNISVKQKNSSTKIARHQQLDLNQTEDSFIWKVLQAPIPQLKNHNQNSKTNQQQNVIYQKKQQKLDQLELNQRNERVEELHYEIRSPDEKWMLEQQPDIDDLDFKDFICGQENEFDILKNDYYFQ